MTLPCILKYIFLFSLPLFSSSDRLTPGSNSKFPVTQTVQSANQPGSELPLKVLGTRTEPGSPLFVFISGDGGWNTFNRTLCENLANKGIPVVALDSKKYFWNEKTPDQTAADVTTVIRTYTKLWRCDKIVIAGYSFGAAIVPFVVNRLPWETKKMVDVSILIAPDNTSDFEIHLSDMLNMEILKGKYDVTREIRDGGFLKYLAVFSSDENKSVAESYHLPGVKVKTFEGSHHFDGAHDALADFIYSEISGK